jgi:hypothetical protein
MIVASLLLILVAVTLLVLGLTGGSSSLLISSIVASLLAAVTLVIGARQAAGLRRSRADSPDAVEIDTPERSFAESDLRASDPHEAEVSHSAPTGEGPSDEPEPQFVTQSIDEPAVEAAADDEPEPQIVTPSDAVRVARLDAEVVVVDGRPRYHVADCPFLAGREPEPIPVNEAVELGFSPCGICRPVDRLVATSAHR